MNTEQAPSPLRMPQHVFAELATGGGSSEALAFLERGERARRLLLLRTLYAHLDGRSSPLGPPSEAWQVLEAAAAAAPDAVERLLLAPQVGTWIGHVLRRVNGTAEGPPLWAEAGHLAALAVTAALHARITAELPVPLIDGALHLPALGMARLHTGSGPTIGRAQVNHGELTLTSDEAGTLHTLVCRPATVSTDAETPPSGMEPHWVPLRTLNHRGPLGTSAIPLDDLGPYRDLDEPVAPARLDAEEVAAWQTLFAEAASILPGLDGDSGLGQLDPSRIRTVVPWGRTSVVPPPPQDVRISATSGDSFGGMVIARPSCHLALAEAFVHEYQHSKLAALLHLFPLLDDDREERYYAPWRADPRHLTGLLHGAYAFTGVAAFWRGRMSEAHDAGTSEIAAYHFALRRMQSRLVARTLLASGRLTEQGHALVSGLAGTLDGWLREPVDPAVVVRARTAAVLHRTEWRLRNVVSAVGAQQASAPLRLRPDRTSWPDTRTQAFAVRSAAPRTADEYLAAGNPATALARYTGELAGEPGEPHALAGWIVARAALEPGRAARRMLARPELHPIGPRG